VTRARQRLVVGAVALVALAAGAFAWSRLPATGHPGGVLTQPPLAVRVSFAPLDGGFGDPVTAVVDVFVDATLVEPASVRILPRFAPYATVARTRVVSAAGPATRIRFTRRLSCLAVDCVPRHALRVFTFPDLTVRYRQIGIATTARVAWPRLSVHSRLSDALRRTPTLRLGDLHSAPPSFRVAPGRAATALSAAAVVLGATGAGLLLALTLMPLLAALRRRPGALERILLELQRTNGDMGRRRSALEQLARELAPLDGELSQESRVLAWAPGEPQPAAIDELARRARALVER
jgi:hypothetical protein